jgi:hypothetical protein
VSHTESSQISHRVWFFRKTQATLRSHEEARERAEANSNQAHSPAPQAAASGSPAFDSSSKQILCPIRWANRYQVPRPTTFSGNQPCFRQWKLVVFQHAWRAAFDPSLRYLVAHKPFWHGYRVSLTVYHMDRWSNGDSFVVNDLGHPPNSAVCRREFLQNDPRSFVQIGLHNGYWTTRLQSFVWMMLRSAEFELGRLRPDDCSEIPADGLTEMLNSGRWTDRNKAGLLLMVLTGARLPRYSSG